METDELQPLKEGELQRREFHDPRAFVGTPCDSSQRPTILLFAGKNPTVFPAKHGLVQANNSAVHDDPSTQGTSEFDLQSVAIFRGRNRVEGLLMNTTEYKQQRSVRSE